MAFRVLVANEILLFFFVVVFFSSYRDIALRFELIGLPRKIARILFYRIA